MSARAAKVVKALCGWAVLVVLIALLCQACGEAIEKGQSAAEVRTIQEDVVARW